MKAIIASILVLSLIPVSTSDQAPQRQHSTWPQHRDFRTIFEIQETHSFGVVEPIDSPEAWLLISDISPGPDGGVLVTDTRQHRVDLVVPGKSVTVIYGLGEGAGPGELSRPWSAAYDRDELIYISEYGNARISVFRKSGEFVRIIRTQHIPGRIAVGNNRDLWIGGGFRQTVDAVDVYELETDHLTISLGGRYLDEPWTGKITYEPYLAHMKDGILVSTYFPYELNIYDSKGEIRKIISRKVDWLAPPEQVPDMPEGVWGLNRGMVRQPGVFPDGSIVVMLARIVRERNEVDAGEDCYLDFYSPDGRWTTTVPLKEIGLDMYIRYMTVALNGGLWFCCYDDDGFPTVMRYQVIPLLK